MKFVYLLMFFLIFPVSLFPFAEGKSEDLIFNFNKTPLVLQWEASHSRNTDQISLIFKQDTLELVTNTSFSKNSKSARLGYFSFPVTTQIKILKEEMYQYYVRLKKTRPVSFQVQGAKSPVSVNPHAPVLRINDQEINNDHIYFQYLESILHHQANNKDWSCIECAIYTLLHEKEHKSKIKVQRILKKESNTTTKTFSLEELNCLLKEPGSWECVDPEFGIIVLSKTENNNSNK